MVQPEVNNHHKNGEKKEKKESIEWSATVITEVDNYYENREKMKTGDLILWKSHKWGWRLWMRITHSTRGYHVSTVIRLKEYEKCHMQVFILETRRSSGAVLNRLSRKLEGFHGEVWWYPLIDEWNPCREKIAKTMLDLVGEPYDFVGIVNETAWYLVGAKIRMFIKKIGKHLVHSGKCIRQGRWYKNLFCSEYCYKGYEATEQLKKTIKRPPLPGKLPDIKDRCGRGIFKPSHGIQIYKGTSLWEILYLQLIGQEKKPLFPTLSKQARLRL